MPEVLTEFPRQWVEFVDPADETNLIRADLTWLTSRWTCIFGRGCGGIDAARPDAGCCVHGAHFSEKKDQKRVAKYVKQLTPAMWEHHDVAQKKGWTEKEDGADKTRVVDGACIFHNSEGFAGGFGCALFHLAQEQGVNPMVTRPEVCWQLPIRRWYEKREYEDEREERDVVVIGEYTRGDWGPGGHDFPWYCSSNTEAHVGTEPVYVSGKAELVELIGEQAYAELARICRQREQLMLTVVDKSGLMPHPADPA